MKAISMKAPAMPKIAGIGKSVLNFFLANRVRIAVIAAAIFWVALIFEAQAAMFSAAGAALLAVCPAEKGGEK